MNHVAINSNVSALPRPQRCNSRDSQHEVLFQWAGCMHGAIPWLKQCSSADPVTTETDQQFSFSKPLCFRNVQITSTDFREHLVANTNLKAPNPKFYEGHCFSRSLLISPEELPLQEKKVHQQHHHQRLFCSIASKGFQTNSLLKNIWHCPSSSAPLWADLVSEFFILNWIVWEILELLSESWFLEMTSSSE